MSSYIIFEGKESAFFDWVENYYADVNSRWDKVPQDEFDEAYHLKILKDYYLNLRIVDRFTPSELTWYESYKQAVAV